LLVLSKVKSLNLLICYSSVLMRCVLLRISWFLPRSKFLVGVKGIDELSKNENASVGGNGRLSGSEDVFWKQIS